MHFNPDKYFGYLSKSHEVAHKMYLSYFTRDFLTDD